jgi:hypothetical protein
MPRICAGASRPDYIYITGMLAFDEGASLASSVARAAVAASHAILLRSSADQRTV